MTETQTAVMEILLAGGNISVVGKGKYSVRDDKHNPIMRIRQSTFAYLKKNNFIKKMNSKTLHLFVVDKAKIIKMSKRFKAKKLYRKSLSDKKAAVPAE